MAAAWLRGDYRLPTDTVSFAHLADVFALPEHRGDGLGIWLMECVLTHPDLQGLRKMLLKASGAHTLYARFGFAAISEPHKLMEKRAAP